MQAQILRANNALRMTSSCVILSDSEGSTLGKKQMHQLQKNFYFYLVNSSLKHDFPKNRFQVYRNHFYTHLTESLQSIYPVIQKLIGEDYFKYICQDFIAGNPSRSGDLHCFGQNFSDFLGQISDLQNFPYLSEMAHLEWAYHQSYYAEDPKTLEILTLNEQFPLESLQEYPRYAQGALFISELDDTQFGKMLFHLHPSTYLFSFQYPIWQIWNYCQTDASENLELGNEGEKLLLRRKGIEIILEKLEEDTYQIFLAMTQNRNLLSAYEAALRVNPDFDLKQFLQKYWLLGSIINNQQ